MAHSVDEAIEIARNEEWGDCEIRERNGAWGLIDHCGIDYFIGNVESLKGAPKIVFLFNPSQLPESERVRLYAEHEEFYRDKSNDREVPLFSAIKILKEEFLNWFTQEIRRINREIDAENAEKINRARRKRKTRFADSLEEAIKITELTNWRTCNAKAGGGYTWWDRTSHDFDQASMIIGLKGFHADSEKYGSEFRVAFDLNELPHDEKMRFYWDNRSKEFSLPSAVSVLFDQWFKNFLESTSDKHY